MGKKEKILAYKAFDNNLKCREFQYEIGSTYETTEQIVLCECGFHASEELADIFNYYPTDSRVCQVEILGDIIRGDNKLVTNKIKILKELTKDELNFGKDNTGIFNSGYRNSGDTNSGDRNSGDFNSGYRNSGDTNSGDRNSGDFNSGDTNSGDTNSGDFNSGDFNSGDFNSGYFNCDTPKEIRVFGKMIKREKWDDCYKPHFLFFNLTEWVPFNKMTDKEKEKNPQAEESEGYLKTLQYKEAFQKSWDQHDLSDNLKIKEIPNFDYEIFLEISGIDVKKYEK